MDRTNRRTFLGQSAIATAGAATLSLTEAQAGGSDNRVSVALVGCGGRGTYLAGVFASDPNVDISWICDVDKNRLAKAKGIAGTEAAREQ